MIEVGKMYNEYTKEERDLLPQLSQAILSEYEGKTVPYMWDGKQWCWVMID